MNTMKNSKKRTSSAKAPEATSGESKINITDSLTPTADFVKSEEWKEIEELFLQLTPERQKAVVAFAKMRLLGRAFDEALQERFGDNLERANFQEVEAFASEWAAKTEKEWKAGAAV
jgi:hypothetical protein